VLSSKAKRLFGCESKFLNVHPNVAMISFPQQNLFTSKK
jgi:hypothetical protein